MASIMADGEKEIQRLLRTPPTDNPTISYLSPRAEFFLKTSLLLAPGRLDSQGRPWSTLWGGSEGFAKPIADSLVRLQTQVDRHYDSVVQALLGSVANHDAPQTQSQETGKMVSGLAVDLENRRRVKLFGRMATGSLSGRDLGKKAQLVIKIEEILGTCPKYLNKKHIVLAVPMPRLVADSPQLSPAAVELLSRADTIFVSSSKGASTMDTNIRGGPPGFVRVASNDADDVVILYPEYSGNRLYQTLGNVQTTPRAGYVVPDFTTGNVLYATGHVEILVGKDASAVLPRSNVVIRVTLAAAIFVENGLVFRGEPGDPSPYNPSTFPDTQDNAGETVTLIKKEEIMPVIYRFRCRVSSPKPVSWIPGQYATMSFQEVMDMGYSHMRDDDPGSLNDDYVRTFNASSANNSRKCRLKESIRRLTRSSLALSWNVDSSK
ncbi:Riboflavin synthase-like beta-barrel [Penicillium alfredii]|uniref:Riboflavin synthase-like beta-barrel n=1 Tax=Penicillium alfredii TaxID=1506179 RepID=A0A9W9FSP2_9EURO|nr:Riboflavin synthase-like beta-barrel [Penicillium alfredii]KAJ5105653.1 Riboflavin synthase-like beta-barrel [Penicillium alfredii]